MKKTIAVDFDGTLCSKAWPGIGDANVELIAQLIEEQKAGTVVILWTCRERRLLREAVKWAETHGLKFDYVNRNSAERVRAYKGDSRKISADIYIDDKAADFKFGKRVKIADKVDVEQEGQENKGEEDGGADNAG